MAHWIIDDHGFGGQFYKCSDCGDSWCDIYDDHLSDENCPSCGAPINHDETEYIEKKKKFTFPSIPELSMIGKSKTIETLQKYEESDAKLKQLTGFNIEQLINLFAAGFTLRAPKVDNLFSPNELRDILKNNRLNGYVSSINEKIYNEVKANGKR